MEFFNAWPLNHYLTLSGIQQSTGQKLYYDIDEDVFTASDALKDINTKVYRMSDQFLIVGKKATVNAVYKQLGDRKVPTITDEAKTNIDKHHAANPIYVMLTGGPTPVPPVATAPPVPTPVPPVVPKRVKKEKLGTGNVPPPTPVPKPASPPKAEPFVPSKRIDLDKIYKAVKDVPAGQCVNVFSGSKVKADTQVIRNSNPLYPLCYLLTAAKSVGDKDSLFRFVEQEMELRKQGDEKKAQPIPKEVIKENEKSKMSSIEALKNTKPAPKPSPPKTTTTAKGPIPTTLEMDTILPQEMGKLRLDLKDYENVNAPVAGDIVDRINASESRISKRNIKPAPKSYFSFGSAHSSDEDEESDEEEDPTTLPQQTPKSGKSSPAMSPQGDVNNGDAFSYEEEGEDTENEEGLEYDQDSE